MKIAFITQALPYLPARDGFRLYAANVLRALARRHQVDLISLTTEDDAGHLAWAKEHCHSLSTLPLTNKRDLLTPASLFATYAWGKPLRCRQSISSLLAAGAQSGRWDVVHVEGGYAGGLVPNRLGLPRVLSVHDSWSLRCAQMATCSPSWRERLYYRVLNLGEPRYERLVYPRFDFSVVVSGADALHIRSVVPDCQLAVIPNGIDTDYYQPAPTPAKGSSFVFHGNLEYGPNIQTAMEFACQIFPLIRSQSPAAQFHLVGARPTAQLREMAAWPGIQLSANLPDLRDAVRSAQVYVCPMRYGTGVKNKLLEAMALGLPIVAYPEAVKGIDCAAGKHLLVADDPREFARLALNLLHDSRRREELGQAARQLVLEEFSWESRAESFEALYREAVENRSRHTFLRASCPRALFSRRLGVFEGLPMGRPLGKVLQFPVTAGAAKVSRWRERS